MELGNEDVILLAGGCIQARRCSAQSKRTRSTFWSFIAPLVSSPPNFHLSVL